MPEGTPDELQWLWSQDATAWAEAIPDDVDPAVRDEVLGQLAEMNDHSQETIANTGEMPPVDELNDHRMAILRNLRDA